MLLLALALQTTPTPPLPRAIPLPPPGAEEAAVLAPIQRMFAALAARDPAALLNEVRPDGMGIAVVERPDGTRTVRQTPWPAFAANLKNGTERLEEKIFNPAIEIDGDIAMVWAPYTFTIDGKLSHCGYDHFSLVRETGKWRVHSITWTQRTTNCPTP